MIGEIAAIGATVIASIAIIVTFYWNTKIYKKMNEQLQIQNQQLKNGFFAEYTKRYQEIILNFPEEINDNSFKIKKHS